MKTLSELKDALLLALDFPFLSTDDGPLISDGFFIRGSLDPKESWRNGIFQNSRFFIISIRPITRWENDCGGKYNVEMISCHLEKPLRMRAKNNSDLGRIFLHVRKWAEKINAQ